MIRDRPTSRLEQPTRAPLRVGAGVLGVAGAAAVVGLVALAGRPWPVVVAGTGLAGVGVLLAVVDARHHRLPDRLVALAYAVVVVPLALGALAGWLPEPSRAWWALGLGACSLLGYLLLGLIKMGGLGLGDVKLSGALGTWLGWFGWPAVLAGPVVTFVLAGVFALVLLATRRADLRSHVALGPWMVVGTAVVTAATGGVLG
ncbi:hypothetical protein GCM10023169_20930 [Georgenia halophila]|uniref:Prepilin type IV endopeptidase peptidase domain-containing protein n=1 Tax=Georgenia halophila TaxID=620889 RepID=A0ABP8L8Q6_9MICO